MSLPQPIRRLVDVTVLAPLGIVSFFVGHLPVCGRQMAQNRQALLNRIQLVQLKGRMVVENASRPGVTTPTPTGPAPQVAAAPDRAPGSRPPAPRTTVSATPITPDGSVAADLPISDYESLAAIHVVHRLGTLRADELERVRAFEQSNRARRTVLAKIKQLQDARS